MFTSSSVSIPSYSSCVPANLMRGIWNLKEKQTTSLLSQQLHSRGLSPVQPQDPLGLAEYALLAQGRKIAARPLRTSNCFTRPVALWPPGLFAFLGPASCGGVAMLPVRLDHWRSAGRLAKLGRRKATEQARKHMAGDGGKPDAGSSAGPGADSYVAMVARAKALIPELRDRASKTEELRRLPPETERDLHDAGLFRIVQPKRVGGAELDYVALVDCADALGQADASVAWNFANLASHHWMLGMFDRQAQDAVWGRNADALIASSFIFPAGRARKVGWRICPAWSLAVLLGRRVLRLEHACRRGVFRR